MSLTPFSFSAPPSQAFAVAFGMFCFAACSSPAPLARTQHSLHQNLSSSGLALGGFDPVAYFEKGGGKAQRGSPAWELEYRGTTYRFASEGNKNQFLEDPEHFEPAYGGWCAWAMVEGDKVDVDPRSYLIQDNRLMVFYDGFFADTRKSWRKGDPVLLERKADQMWKQVLQNEKSFALEGAR